MKKDTYQTLKALCEGEFKDRGSKFIAYAFPITNEEDWQLALAKVQKLHAKARHWCYAYRLGLDGNNFRANDDGEPSGTAGKPILGRIDSFGLTNVLVVVVRYFGGTLLGASGLINAYKNATISALEKGVIIEKVVADIYQFTFDYRIMSDVMNAIKRHDLEMVHQDFGEIGKVQVAIRQSAVVDTLLRMKAQIAKVHLEMVADLEEIEGLTIELIKEKA
ncbi:MAG: YigZ family protein [Bacteroidota bacterium]